MLVACVHMLQTDCVSFNTVPNEVVIVFHIFGSDMEDEIVYKSNDEDIVVV